jgi:hypothetical protein
MGDFVEKTTSSVVPFLEIGLLSRRELLPAAIASLKVGNLKKSLQNVMRLYLPSSGSLNASRVTWPPPTGVFPLGHLSGLFLPSPQEFFGSLLSFPSLPSLQRI